MLFDDYCVIILFIPVWSHCITYQGQKDINFTKPLAKSKRQRCGEIINAAKKRGQSLDGQEVTARVCHN